MENKSANPPPTSTSTPTSASAPTSAPASASAAAKNSDGAVLTKKSALFALGATTALGGAALAYSLWRRRGGSRVLRQSSKYPATRRGSHVDHYTTKKGLKQAIPDPYEWLSNPKSKETLEWIDAQNRVTDGEFKTCEPIRSKLKDGINKVLNYERQSPPSRKGDRYFFSRNTGLQRHAVHYTMKNLEDEPTVLIDPNAFEDETSSLMSKHISKDARWCAYTVSTAGSDMRDIHVMNIETGEKLETVPQAKFPSIAWVGDSTAFFYSKAEVTKGVKGEDGLQSPDKVTNSLIYFHELGTDPEKDVLVTTAEKLGNKDWLCGVSMSQEHEYLLISVSESTDPEHKVLYMDIRDLDAVKEGTAKIVSLIDNFDAEYDFITNDDTRFYFKTSLGAPKKRVIAIDLSEPDAIEEIVPERKDFLNYVCPVNNDQFILAYLRDVTSHFELCDMKGQVIRADLLGDRIGSVSSIAVRREFSEFFISFSSFTMPATVFRMDLAKPDAQFEVHFRPTLHDFNADNFVTRQVFYSSKDGTKVPMFINYHKSTKLDGTAPALLYGYGGFSISIEPYFSPSKIVLMKNLGAVFAVANIRGGAEYGEDWHKCAMKENRQRCYDDFTAAGEYLIKENYTRRSALAIEGGSNGGLLVGACINQRPDLFGCAIAHCGVMDLLKFHKYTIGHFWASEYGRSDNPDEFDHLLKISPYHNVRPAPAVVAASQDGEGEAGGYPATLVVCADHDDRVVPLHSYKLVAEMQHVLGGRPEQTRPLIARIDTKTGHGAGKPLDKQVIETADCYGFFAKHTGAQWRDGAALA